MKRYKMLSKTSEIRSKMVDEESVILYDARLDFLLDRFFYEYAKTVFNIGRQWNIPELDTTISDIGGTEVIIIYGCGVKGDYTRRLIACSKYDDMNVMFCDPCGLSAGKSLNMCVAGKAITTPIISVNDMKQMADKSVIIVAPDSDELMSFDNLHSLFIPTIRIILPQSIHGYRLHGLTGKQYFDFFEPLNGEVFLDVGCFDGGTSVGFAKWCGGQYERILAFEANTHMADTSRRTFEKYGLHNVELCDKAAWNRIDELNFQIDQGIYQGGCRVSSVGEEIVQADTIDNVLNGGRATFIKMDIEGSELKALMGAEKTIRTYKPRLAISIYHMRKDIIDIPYLISEFNPEYKFAIRQYATFLEETVLYAW